MILQVFNFDDIPEEWRARVRKSILHILVELFIRFVIAFYNSHDGLLKQPWVFCSFRGKARRPAELPLRSSATASLLLIATWITRLFVFASSLKRKSKFEIIVRLPLMFFWSQTFRVDANTPASPLKTTRASQRNAMLGGVPFGSCDPVFGT